MFMFYVLYDFYEIKNSVSQLQTANTKYYHFLPILHEKVQLQLHVRDSLLTLMWFHVFVNSFDMPSQIRIQSKFWRTDLTFKRFQVLVDCFNMLSQTISHSKFWVTNLTFKRFQALVHCFNVSLEMTTLSKFSWAYFTFNNLRLKWTFLMWVLRVPSPPNFAWQIWH